MEMTIGKRFMITSGSCVLLMLFLAGVSIYGLYTVGEATDELGKSEIPSTHFTMALASDLNKLRGDFWKRLAVETVERRAAEDSEILVDEGQLAEDLKGYKVFMDAGDDTKNFEAFTVEANALAAAWQQVVPVDDLGKADDSTNLFLKTVAPRNEQAQEILNRMVSYNNKTANDNTAASIATSSHALWLTGILALIAFISGTAVSWFMINKVNIVLRQATQELNEGASQVVSASAQVNSSSQSLAQGSSEQAATIEETSASAHEINSMAQRNTTNSLAIATMVDTSQRSFTETNVLLDGLLEAMNGIDISSQKISKVIKVIDDIAFQTNILALNAAVEAARAGEAGMGFAVVADEVRSLAQRSAAASKDTASMIEESIQKSSRGKLSVEHVASAIRSLALDSSKMKVLVDEIHLGSSEQAKGFDQITNSIQQMEKVTQNTAASSEESASAAEELSAQAESVQAIVKRLEALVDGGSTSPAPRATLTSRGPAVRSFQGKPIARMPMTSAFKASSQKKTTAVNEFPMEESFQSF